MSQTGTDMTQITSPSAQGQQSLMAGKKLKHLRALEAESIFILREAAAEFANPVMLYSIGKDSSVMLRLAQKAFFPGKLPFPLLHIDTSYKFPEMIEFRDRYAKELGAELIVHKNRVALDAGASPFVLGTQKCCGLLKTRALLDALAARGFTAAFGGARRDEEKSRRAPPKAAVNPRAARASSSARVFSSPQHFCVPSTNGLAPASSATRFLCTMSSAPSSLA